LTAKQLIYDASARRQLRKATRSRSRLAGSSATSAVVLEPRFTIARSRQHRRVAEEYVALVQAGIIDPAKLAASVGGMIRSTEAVVTDSPESTALATASL
jgi:hypothetical protein